MEDKKDNLYQIPVSRLAELQKKVKTLNNRAKKSKLPEITVSVDPKYVVHRVTFKDGESCNIAFANVTVEGLLPVVEGYTFICKIEHTRDNKTGELIGNMVKGMSKEEYPEEYRTLHSNCEHCKTKRYRKETFIIESPEKKRMQVGTECLTNYITKHSLEAMMHFLKTVQELSDFDDMDKVSRVPDVVDLYQFIEACVESVKIHGWVPKTLQIDRTRSYTYSRGWEQFYPIKLTDDRGNVIYESEHYKISEETTQAVKEYVDLFRAKTPMNTFEHNLQIILKQEILFKKDCGFAAVVAKNILNATAKKIEKKARVNDHFGKIGDKVELVVTIKARRSFENNFGYRGSVSYLIEMIEDKTGHTFKAFTSVPYCPSTTGDERSVEVGDRFIVQGTIKDHTEYKEFKTTQLTRIKFREWIKPA